ncbi:hypothetical protein WG66_010637 [Moniliophthora roreri]|nr:hypothetical protein WG66_010637 [Moniliophthora roreri]
MSETGSSTPKPKPRGDLTQTQMMIEISTAVLEEMEKKKNKGSKVATPDPFEGDRKDTKRFLMEVEIYLRMHPTKYDNDEKKCLFLLSYLRGKGTESWKKGQSAKIFEPKSGVTPLTFQGLKDEFKKHYLPADIQAEAQIRIEEAKMTDRADNYVNDFRVMADESGYDDQALIHIFRKGLPNSLSVKILNQPQGRPADLEGCLPDTPPGISAFSDDVTYTGPFHPSPFELLFLVNTGGHDDALRNASAGQPHLQYAVDGLIRLRAQRVSLNAIIEETNVYAANLAFNAVAAGPAPLILQGPMTVPSLPPRSMTFEPQLPISVPRLLGSLSSDICDADPNSPEFIRAATTYNTRIRAAVELARDQHEFCPRHTRTEPVLSRLVGPSTMVPKLESPADPDPIKPEPDADTSSDLLYPSDSASRDSSPIYAQSIGIATASPSPIPESPTPESQPKSPSTPAPSDPFNPFDVNDEPLAPSTVPFLANGQFNPAFVSIRDVARANPGVPLDARALPDTPPGISAFSDDVTYTGPFHPSPFELLFLVNTGGHDDALRNASAGQPHLQYAVDGLIRLRAQRVSLNAIIEETNVYAANLAFNAVAAGPAPLILQGPMTVPSLPPRSMTFEPQLPISVPRLLGSLSSDICDADPNSPEFIRAATTYNTRIRAAVELARDQHEFCPRHTRTEPVLSRLVGPSTMVPKLESPADPDPIKPEPDADTSSDLLYPSDSASRDSSPIYAQSIGIATASPSPIPESPTPESQPKSPSTPAPSDPFNPFDVNDEPLAPSTVPFLANGQFNPAFVSIRDVARANPGVPLDARAFTNAWGDWTPTRYSPADWSRTQYGGTSFSMGRRDRLRNSGTEGTAEWRTTAPDTVRAIVARSADYLHLGIYLGIVVSDEGRIDFLERTIPGAHALLTTISTGVTTTTTSTETENSNGQETGEITNPDDLVPVFVGIPDHGPQDVTLPDGRIVQVVRMGSAT